MNNPKLIPAPFATNGQKNSIPDRFSSEMPSNTATWDQGFPPITTIPATAGGLPPIGQDFNGIFNQVSENIVFLAEGGRYKFSEEHAVSIGGYKQGAILQSDDNLSEYQSLIDGNLVNFNTAPEIEVSAAWKKIFPIALSNAIDSTSETTAATSKAVSDLAGILALKAALDSPSFTGTPTAPTASQDEVDFRLANTAFVAQAIAQLNGGAPLSLNTLKKLAQAINNDASFSSTINTALDARARLSDFASAKTATTIVGNQPNGLRFMCGEVSAPTDAGGNVFITLPDTFLNKVIYAAAHQSKDSYVADNEPFIFSSYPSAAGPTSTISFAVRNTKTGVPWVNSAINLMYFVRGY